MKKDTKPASLFDMRPFYISAGKFLEELKPVLFSHRTKSIANIAEFL